MNRGSIVGGGYSPAPGWVQRISEPYGKWLEGLSIPIDTQQSADSDVIKRCHASRASLLCRRRNLPHGWGNTPFASSWMHPSTGYLALLTTVHRFRYPLYPAWRRGITAPTILPLFKMTLPDYIENQDSQTV